MKKNGLIILTAVFIIAILSIRILYKGNNGKEYMIDSRVDKIEELNNNTPMITLGWIKVEGTNIDYPIIYKNVHSDKENIDYLWSPSLTEELTNGENRLVIYGHNIKNVSSHPLYKKTNLVRFEELMYFVYYDFVKDNQFIQLTYNGEDHLYRVYAVQFTSASKDDGEMTYTKEETANYIKNVMEGSIYNFHVDVNQDDNIISLITCTRFFGLTSDMTQFKVDAREVRENEKAVNSRVTKTSNYGIIEEIIGGNDE